MTRYFIEIRERETDTLVRRVECDSRRLMDSVEAALNIGLDHTLHYTRQVVTITDREDGK